MSCPHCGYCSHCGRSNQRGGLYWQGLGSYAGLQAQGSMLGQTNENLAQFYLQAAAQGQLSQADQNLQAQAQSHRGQMGLAQSQAQMGANCNHDHDDE